MENILRNGASWLARQLQQSAGDAVAFRRRGWSSIDITATCKQQEYELIGEDGVPTIARLVDWVVAVSELVHESTSFDPRPGDEIAFTQSGVTTVYSVVPIGDRKCCEVIDNHGLIVVIHTKQVG